MPLRYNGITIGKINVIQEFAEHKKQYTIQIRQGNCLAVLLYVRKATEEELKKNPEGKWYHQLWSFYSNEQHLKNIMKEYGDVLYGEFEKVTSISLNLYYKENLTLLKYFTKSGHKVTCYYKEPKKKK